MPNIIREIRPRNLEAIKNKLNEKLQISDIGYAISDIELVIKSGGKRWREVEDEYRSFRKSIKGEVQEFIQTSQEDPV